MKIKRIALMFWQCAGCKIMVDGRYNYCPRCGLWRWEHRTP